MEDRQALETATVDSEETIATENQKVPTSLVKVIYVFRVLVIGHEAFLSFIIVSTEAAKSDQAIKSLFKYFLKMFEKLHLCRLYTSTVVHLISSLSEISASSKAKTISKENLDAMKNACYVYVYVIFTTLISRPNIENDVLLMYLLHFESLGLNHVYYLCQQCVSFHHDTPLLSYLMT